MKSKPKNRKFTLSKRQFLFLLFLFILVFILITYKFNMIFFLMLSVIFLFYSVVAILTYFIYPNVAKTKSFPKKIPTVAAVTYAFNNWRAVEKTVKRLLELEYPKPFKVYVICDNTCGFLKKYKNVELIVLDKQYFSNKQKNVKATIMNIGLKKIKADNLLCVDGDTIPNKDVLMKMTGHMKNNVAVVNGVLLPSNSKNLLEKLQMIEYNLGWGFMLRILSALNSISVAVGGMCLMNKKVFDELGGYDIENVTEDREYAYRLIKQGYVLRCCEEARGATETPDNIKTFFKQRLRWYSGELNTVYKHRDVFFNNELDVFGLIVLPLIFILQLIGISVLMRLLFVNLKNWIIYMYYLLIEVIKQKVVYFAIPNYFYMPSTIIFSVMMFGILIFFSFLAFSFSNFKLEMKYYIPYIIFITMYGPFAIFIYFYAMVLEFIGRGFRWVKS